MQAQDNIVSGRRLHLNGRLAASFDAAWHELAAGEDGAAPVAAGPAAPSSAPLGTVCGICSQVACGGHVEDSRRAGRYALQSVARSWLYDDAEGLAFSWHRLGGCHRWFATKTVVDNAYASAVPGDRGRLAFPHTREKRSDIDVLFDPGKSRAYYAGLQSCGSATACPVCSGAVYDHRKAELAELLRVARERGWRVYFITLTARHSASMALGPFLDSLLGAVRDVYKSRGFTAFKCASGYQGAVRALETTYGQHGWHPHFHLLWLCDPAAAVAPSRRCAGRPAGVDSAVNSDLPVSRRLRARHPVASLVRRLWLAALRQHGLTGLRDVAATVYNGSDSLEAYMAKYAECHPDASFDRPLSWDLDAELSMWVRKDGSSRGSYSPFDLLRLGLSSADSAPGVVARVRELYREYAEAVRGKHSMHWSPGLRAQTGIACATDEEVAAGEANARPLVKLASLTLAQWHRVLGNDARGELLDVASSGDVEALRAWLDSIGALPVDTGFGAQLEYESLGPLDLDYLDYCASLGDVEVAIRDRLWRLGDDGWVPRRSSA